MKAPLIDKSILTHEYHLEQAFLAGHAHAQNRWVKVTPETMPEDKSFIWACDAETCHFVVFKTERSDAFLRLFTHYMILPNKAPQPPEHG